MNYCVQLCPSVSYSIKSIITKRLLLGMCPTISQHVVRISFALCSGFFPGWQHFHQLQSISIVFGYCSPNEWFPGDGFCKILNNRQYNRTKLNIGLYAIFHNCCNQRCCCCCCFLFFSFLPVGKFSLCNEQQAIKCILCSQNDMKAEQIYSFPIPAVRCLLSVQSNVTPLRSN